MNTTSIRGRKPIGGYDRIEKQCSRCKQILLLSYFGKCRTNWDGLYHKCKECQRASNNDWNIKNLEKKRESGRKAQRKIRNRELGISDEDYNKLYKLQNGKCAICSVRTDNNTGLCVDHDHMTGKIRGLICTPCNVGIGNLGDSADRVYAAWQYLLRSQDIEDNLFKTVS